MCSNPVLIEGKKVVLLYDFDSKKIDENNNNIYIRSTAKNEQNKIIKKGIENLLVFPDSFNLNHYYNSHEKKDDYGGKIVKIELDKVSLCDAVCSLDKSAQEIILRNLKKTLFDIKAIFDNE